MVHSKKRGQFVLLGAVRHARRRAGAGRLRRRRAVRHGGFSTFDGGLVRAALDCRNYDRLVRSGRRSTDSECLRALARGFRYFSVQKTKEKKNGAALTPLRSF